MKFQPGQGSEPKGEQQKINAKKASQTRQKDAQDGLSTQINALTPQERAALNALFSRETKRPPAPRMKVVGDNGRYQITTDHDEETAGRLLLMNAVGTTDNDFFNGLLNQIFNATSHGQEPDERGINFMLSVVKGVEPQDEVEAMLATQMAAVHMATMTFARRLAHVENVPQQDSAERAFNKLARTFTAQVEALKRYRTGGEQKVTVQHVTVNEGGQAVVGNVSRSAGGRGRRKNDGQPHEPCGEDAKGSPLQGTLETHEGAVQGAGGAGLERVPLSRRRWRSAKGRAQRRIPTWWIYSGGRRSLSVCQGAGEAGEADTGRDCIDAKSTLRPSVSGRSRH